MDQIEEMEDIREELREMVEEFVALRKEHQGEYHEIQWKFRSDTFRRKWEGRAAKFESKKKEKLLKKLDAIIIQNYMEAQCSLAAIKNPEKPFRVTGIHN